MGAGIPNYQKLYEMGKLPKSARANVPMLAQLDAAEKKIKELEAEIAKMNGKIFRGESENKPIEGVIVKEPEVVNATGGSLIKVKCEVEGCDYTGEGRTEGIARNILRMHGKTHEVKE